MECTNDKKFFKTIINMELILDILLDVEIDLKNPKYGHMYGFINLTNTVSNNFKIFQLSYINLDVIIVYFCVDKQIVDLFNCLINAIKTHKTLVINHLDFYLNKYCNHLKNNMDLLNKIKKNIIYKLLIN